MNIKKPLEFAEIIDKQIENEENGELNLGGQSSCIDGVKNSEISE